MNANHNQSEDQPRNINSDEIGKKPAAKTIESQQKIGINESGFGREQGQTPADEHIESRLSQMDEETVALQNNSKAIKDGLTDANEINDTDVRDQNDSTTDWDAENSKTGRHK